MTKVSTQFMPPIVNKEAEARKFLDSAIAGLAKLQNQTNISMFYRDMKEVDNMIWGIIDCIDSMMNKIYCENEKSVFRHGC